MAVVIVTTLVLGFEIALRVAELPGRLARARTVEKGLYRLDDAAGYVMVPGFSGRLATQEFDQPYRTNSLGLRGPELPAAKPPGEFRIVVLGDSFTFGGQVAEEQRFTERSEALLRERGYNQVRVVNAGVGGWTTFNEVGFLKANLSRLQPDLVIVATFLGNDIGENILATAGGYRMDDTNPNGIAYGPRAREMLRYSTDWFDHNREVGAIAPGGEPRGPVPRWNEGDPFPQPRGNAVQGPPGSPFAQPDPVVVDQVPPFERLRKGLSDNSRAYSTLSDLWFQARRGYPRPDPLNVATWATWVLTDPPRFVDIQRAIPMAVSYLKQARDTAATVGAPTVQMIIPHVAQVADGKRAETLRTFALSPDEVNMDLPRREFAERDARESIPLIDLTAALRARPDAASLYFPIDEHFTAAGHQAAAEALAEGLERLSVLPPKT